MSSLMQFGFPLKNASMYYIPSNAVPKPHAPFSP
jgi:hypothetical protein